MKSPLPPTPKILVIKLADLGDVLTATPALRALRQSYPQATIDLLLTHHTLPAMQYSSLVDTLIPSDNFRFFNPTEALKPNLFKEGIALLRQIRRQEYDAVLVFHHLTTRAGAFKYAAIARASRAKIVAGLKPPGRRGNFFTHSIPDRGFGQHHEIDYWLDVAALIGANSDDRPKVELAITPDDEAWAKQLISTLQSPPPTRSPAHPLTCSPAHLPPHPLVIIHPGSGGFSTARRWAAANFAIVADALSEAGAQIILVGTQDDGIDAVRTAMKTEPFDLSGQTSLHQLAALLRRADLFIGGDSGVIHIAAASGVPMVAIFGPTNPAAWGPVGPKRVVLQAGIPCGPCAYVEHRVGLRNGCPAKTCLKLVTPEQVIEAAERLLKDKGAQSGVKDEGGRKASSRFACLLPSAFILGVRVHAVTFEQALAQIEGFIAEGGPHQVATVNSEFIVAAQKDCVFRRIINRAALSFPDGAGVLQAARQLEQPELPERIPGVDTVEALAAMSAQKGYRIYFLGAWPGVAEKAVAALQRRYPGMAVAGYFAGSPRAEDEDEIVAKIQAAQPDIVLVAYGAPQQDKWIARNMSRLPASVLMGVGGAFDFISGVSKRAPRWMQRMNLEWLHRLIRQPWRWRRIWNAVPRFMWLVFWEQIRRK